jgi:hypothetical protein
VDFVALGDVYDMGWLTLHARPTFPHGLSLRLRIYLQVLAVGCDASEVQLVFDDLDVNGSHDVSYKEFADKFGYLKRGRGGDSGGSGGSRKQPLPQLQPRSPAQRSPELRQSGCQDGGAADVQDGGAADDSEVDVELQPVFPLTLHGADADAGAATAPSTCTQNLVAAANELKSLVLALHYAMQDRRTPLLVWMIGAVAVG